MPDFDTSPDDVVRRAAQYLRLITQVATPNEVCFRTFAPDGVDGLSELCDSAATTATAAHVDALASLVVAKGDANTFDISGTHARATLNVCPNPHTRLYLILIIFVLVLACVWCRQRGPLPQPPGRRDIT